MRYRLMLLTPILLAFQCGKEPGTDDTNAVEVPDPDDSGVTKDGCLEFKNGTIYIVIPEEDTMPPAALSTFSSAFWADPSVEHWLQTRQAPEVAQGCFVPQQATQDRIDFMVQCPWGQGHFFLQDEGNNKAYLEGGVNVWGQWLMEMQGQVDPGQQTIAGQSTANIDDQAAAYIAEYVTTYTNPGVDGIYEYENEVLKLQMSFEAELESLADPPPANDMVWDPADYLDRPMAWESFTFTAVIDGQEQEIVVSPTDPYAFTGPITLETAGGTGSAETEAKALFEFDWVRDQMEDPPEQPDGCASEDFEVGVELELRFSENE